MTTTLRTIVFGLGFATLGAVTVIGTTAIAQQGRGASAAYGQGYGQGQGQGQGQALRSRGSMMGQLNALAQELDLSDEQKALGRELREDLLTITQDHGSARGSEREAILEAMQADPVDEAAIHDLIDARQTRQAEMSHAVADAALEFYASLDAEQQAVAMERAEQATARMGRRRSALQDPLGE
jgi:Spy/CpxP family protein refolding chaperone